MFRTVNLNFCAKIKFFEGNFLIFLYFLRLCQQCAKLKKMAIYDG